MHIKAICVQPLYACRHTGERACRHTLTGVPGHVHRWLSVSRRDEDADVSLAVALSLSLAEQEAAGARARAAADSRELAQSRASGVEDAYARQLKAAIAASLARRGAGETAPAHTPSASAEPVFETGMASRSGLHDGPPAAPAPSAPAPSAPSPPPLPPDQFPAPRHVVARAFPEPAWVRMPGL